MLTVQCIAALTTKLKDNLKQIRYIIYITSNVLCGL